MEYEITQIDNLDEAKYQLIDCHSLINILNVISSEIQVLALDLCEYNLFKDIVQQIKELAEGIVANPKKYLHKNQVVAVHTSIAKVLAELKPKDEGMQKAVATTNDNLQPIMEILEQRIEESRQRLFGSDQTNFVNSMQIEKNMRVFLQSVAQNSKGRYGIVFNIAAQKPDDYLFHLDVSSQDNLDFGIPSLIQDIMRDLIANARKYSAVGSHIHAGIYCAINQLVIIVNDNGRGIPIHEIHNVANFGYRASNAQDISTKGGGFGLTKVFLVTKKFQGRMWISSSPGMGSRIRLQIPLPLIASNIF